MAASCEVIFGDGVQPACTSGNIVIVASTKNLEDQLLAPLHSSVTPAARTSANKTDLIWGSPLGRNFRRKGTASMPDPKRPRRVTQPWTASVFHARQPELEAA